MPPKKTLFLALFGLGRAGSFHLINIARHPLARLLYVVDIDKERREEVAETYSCRALETPEEALRDERVNAVIIATPTDTHYDLIIKSLDAGKAIFTEKPVGFSLKEIDHVFLKAKALGLPLLCGFNRRFDRSWVKTYEAVANGSIGRVQLVRSTARDSPTPNVDYLKTSHGFFHDSGVHDIDVVCWMLNDFPNEVYAVTHTYIEEIRNLGDVDTIVIVLKFKSGVIATIDLSRKSVYGYDQRVELFGDKGMVQVENKPTTTSVLSTANGCVHDNIQFSFPQRFEEAYYLELDHFVQVVLQNIPPKLSHVDCRNVYIIAETARSSAEMQKPLEIHYPPFHETKE